MVNDMMLAWRGRTLIATAQCAYVAKVAHIVRHGWYDVDDGSNSQKDSLGIGKIKLNTTF